MCNCLDEFMGKVFDAVKENLGPNPQLLDEPNIEQLMLDIDNNRWVTYNSVSIPYDIEKKDGSRSRPKKKIVSLVHTYCPICGKKIEVKDR